MFSKTITNSSKFLMMPQSSQNLYFHLGMNADDDGFCEHFAVMRMTDSKPDDLSVLATKNFVHIFDNKVLIVLDWKENNYLRNDRYTPSKYLKLYKEELAQILSEKKQVDLFGIPNGNQMDTQVRLGKDSIYKRESVPLSTLFEEKIKILETHINYQLLVTEKEKFLEYWTQKNHNGKKEYWQMQRVFDVEKRWRTWLRNAEKYMKPKEYKKPVDNSPRGGGFSRI